MQITTLSHIHPEGLFFVISLVNSFSFGQPEKSVSSTHEGERDGHITHMFDLRDGHMFDLRDGHMFDLRDGQMFDLIDGHIFDLIDGHMFDLRDGHIFGLRWSHVFRLVTWTFI